MTVSMPKPIFRFARNDRICECISCSKGDIFEFYKQQKLKSEPADLQQYGAAKALETGITEENISEEERIEISHLVGAKQGSSACGNLMPLIRNIEGLHDCLAQTIIKENCPLGAAEIMFLRKSLGWSGTDFARHMHCDKSQVSKWERGAVEMSKPYDLLLREKVVSGKKIMDYHSEALIWRKNIKPRPLRFRMQTHLWQEAA